MSKRFTFTFTDEQLAAILRRARQQTALQVCHITEPSGVADEEVRIQTPLGVIAVQWEHDADGYASVSVLRIADSETECAASWDAHIQLPDSPPVSGGEERKEVYDYICRREGLKPLKHGGWRYGDKRQQGGK